MRTYGFLVFAVVAFGSGLTGCGGGGDDDDDTVGGEGEGEGECEDLDHDGYGNGPGCTGDDCDEGNPGRHEGCGEDCAAMPEDVGCPCSGQPIPCFDAAVDLAGVGACTAGLRRCEEGIWSYCAGQTLPSDETCDLQDNDCNGTVDEGVTNECGTCGGSCELDEIGPGEFDVDGEGNGVIETPDGTLTLSEFARVQPYMWIASQTDSTVTLMELDTHDQIARYLISESEGLEQPMSISVTPWSGAVVAVGDSVGEWSRGRKITRIAYAPCPDTDADGQVRTSGSWDDLLEFGDDDCVLWSKTYDQDFRVVTWETRDELDGRADYIWAGATDASLVFELDDQGEETGREVNLQFPPSGLVVMPDGRVAVAAEWPSTGLAIFETTNLDMETWVTPQGEKLCSLATDVNGNIWYPNDLGSQMFDVVEETIVSIPQCFGTVAATDQVFWGGWCAHDITIMSLDVAEQTAYPLPDMGFNWGFPWPSATTTEELFVLDAPSDQVLLMDQATGDYEVVADNIPAPGTCGDPTGVSNFRSVGSPGEYRHVFEGCAGGADTTWATVTYDAVLPVGTSIHFSVQIADDIAHLPNAPAVPVGDAPEDASPIPLGPAFGGDNPVGGVLALRITMTPSETDVPELRSFGVTRSCEAGPD